MKITVTLFRQGITTTKNCTVQPNETGLKVAVIPSHIPVVDATFSPHAHIDLNDPYHDPFAEAQNPFGARLGTVAHNGMIMDTHNERMSSIVHRDSQSLEVKRDIGPVGVITIMEKGDTIAQAVAATGGAYLAYMELMALEQTK